MGTSTTTIRSRLMEGIRSILDRLPQRELDIRRRCACDAYFHSICRDYEEAAGALQYWVRASSEGHSKGGRNVEEYTSFLGELEAEILALLNGSTSDGGEA